MTYQDCYCTAVTMPDDVSALLLDCRAASGRRGSGARGAGRASSLRKGEATRQAIVTHALHVASSRGLDAVTFGAIAEQLKMCKAGVFTHFGSREKLLTDVLDLYQTMFKDRVLLPSLKRPPGLPRLASMYVLWMERFIAGTDANCLFISGAITSGAHEGAVWEKLQEMVHAWKGQLHRCVVQTVDVGHLRGDTDPWQIVYEIYGLALGLHHGLSLSDTSGGIERAMHGFERLIRAHARRNP